MYCDRCGAEIQGAGRFCHSCGNPLHVSAAPPAVSRQGRVAGQVRVLGALWIVWSFLHLIPAFGAFLLGPFIARSAAWPEFHHFGWPEHFMIALFGGILGLVSILGLVAGWALLTYQSWARIFLIVMACLALFNFPIGTALGVYTLWVLLPSESAKEYRRMTTA